MLQISSSFKFPRVAPLDVFAMKLSKLEHPECQTRLSGFPRLAKFGHQQLIGLLFIILDDLP
jgi:hypothetical protein